MNIIFVNRYFYPDHSATSQLLSDLVFAISEHRQSVIVLTSRQLYENPTVVLPKNEILGKVTVQRVWSTRFGRQNLIGRLLDYATFYVSVAVALFKETHRGDIIVAKTDPPMLSILVRPIAWLRHAHHINWLHDLFPEIAEAYGIGQKNRLMPILYRVLQSLRNWSLRNATCNVAIGERMADQLLNKGIPRACIRVIPNWADGRILSPILPHQNPLRQTWRYHEEFVVGHSGNLGRPHDYQTFLGAMETLYTLEMQSSQKRSKAQGPVSVPNPKVSWLFIGGGAHYELLKRHVQEKSLPNVAFYPYQQQRVLAQSLSVADVHLISLQKAFEGFIVPSKFYGIAAVGRPTIFIGAYQGDIQDYIRKAQCGFIVAEGDEDGLVQAIRTLAENKSLCLEMGRRARHLFETHLHHQFAFEAWQSLFEEFREKKTLLN